MRKLIPQSLLNLYHLLWAELSAYVYKHPSRKLFVIGITGTKGKSTTTELVRALLVEAGYSVAVASTIRFMIGNESEPNLFKMTMPGHGYLQKFMRKAVDAGCTHVIIEMTSEGAKQFRHRGIELDALIFTNLAPEHIESHGSFEKYLAAKLSLAEALALSPKRPRYMVANADDEHGKEFLATEVEYRIPFTLKDAEPYSTDDKSVRFVWQGGELFTVPLPGVFNLKNILAALALGQALGLTQSSMKRALERIAPIAGRAERVECGQDFAVVVDYAHTPDSLKALYSAYEGHRLVCVLGSTGGGRDTWKRPEMGRIADEMCAVSILTNEDPYDEEPTKIIKEISSGFATHTPRIILDRREAIRAALSEARQGDAVLISGKGTDPFIMGPSGTKEVWSDKRVAEEELQTLLGSQKTR